MPTQNSTLAFDEPITSATLVPYENLNNSIIIYDYLDNTGAALVVGTGQEFRGLTLFGEVTGGVIRQTTSGAVDLVSGVILNDVTFEGVITADSQIIFKTGLAMTGADGTGAGEIDDQYNYVALIFEGGQTLYNAVVNLSGGATLTFTQTSTTTAQTLTFAAGATLNLTGADLREDDSLTPPVGGGIQNNGLISVNNSVSSSQIYVDGFSNAGVISVATGGYLELVISHALSNTGVISLMNGATAYISAETTLTSSGKIDVNGAIANIYAGTTLVNSGEINLKNGASVSLSGGTGLTNTASGVITIASGATLSANNMQNQGLISVDGGTLYLSWTTAAPSFGVVNATDAVIDLSGPMTTADLAEFTGSSNTVFAYGAVDNTGAVFTPTGLFTFSGPNSALIGGVIQSPGADLQFRGGAGLEDVTVDGPLTLGADTVAEVTNLILLGADGSGPGELDIGGGPDSSQVTFGVGQSLDDATIDLAFNGKLISEGLTLGANAVLNVTGQAVDITAGGIGAGTYLVNGGQINVDIAGGGEANIIGAHFTNTGEVIIKSGDQLNLVTATAIDNSVGQITIEAGGALVFGQTSEIATEVGDIVDAGTLYLERTLDANATLEMSGSGTALLAIGAQKGSTVIFDAGASAGVLVEAGARVSMDVEGFGPTDFIDLRELSFASLQTPTVAYANGETTMTLTDGTHTATLILFGQYAAAGHLKAVSDTKGGVSVYGYAETPTTPAVVAPH